MALQRLVDIKQTMAIQEYLVGRPLLVLASGLIAVSARSYVEFVMTMFDPLLQFASYQVALAIYNVFFHPLSKYPGPKLASATQIPCFWYTLRGTLPHWIKDVHERFDADIVRISPGELSFINASAWKDIHGARPGRPSFEKDQRVYGKPPNGVASLLTSNREDHSRMRRILGHAFSDRASREQEPIVEGYVDVLIKRLEEQVAASGAETDISTWYRWLAFDIAGDLSFGESFQCLQNQELHSWVSMIAGFLKADVCLGACNRFSAFQKILPYLIPSQTRRMMSDHWAATQKKVSQRLELGAKRPDFISPIIKYNEEGKGLTKGEIQSCASLFIVAGSDSTATVLTGTTYYLLQHPKAMGELINEIRSTFRTEAEINAQSVSKLPYLIACLNETSRMYPPVQTGQAVVVPAGGDMIGDEWIPGGVGFHPSIFFVPTDECTVRVIHQHVCGLSFPEKLQESQRVHP